MSTDDPVINPASAVVLHLSLNAIVLRRRRREFIAVIEGNARPPKLKEKLDPKMRAKLKALYKSDYDTKVAFIEEQLDLLHPLNFLRASLSSESPAARRKLRAIAADLAEGVQLLLKVLDEAPSLQLVPPTDT